MIVSCSACATRYLIEPADLGPKGRVVRCANCGHSWQQTPPADMPHRIDADGPPPGQVVLPQMARARRMWSRGIGFPLLIILLLLLAGGYGYFFRDKVIQRWPQAAQIYELIGVSTAPDSALKKEGGTGDAGPG